jgi:tRNA (guanosine-2'-O-)-methyltransferase
MERMLSVLEHRMGSLRVVVENLHNPHNMSAVLRSCEAMGVQHVHAVESVEKFSVSRGITKGSHKWLTLHKHRTFSDCASELAAEGFSLYAAMLQKDAVALAELPIDRNVALVFGNEHAGVSPEALALCDGAYFIPMHGFVQSYNVSVATSISIYDVSSRMRTGREDKGALTGEQKALILESWLPKVAPYTRKIANIFNQRN